MESALRRIVLKIIPSDLRSFWIATLIAGAIVTALAIIATPYMAIATVAYILLVAGVLFRSHKKLHVPLMVLGVLIDLALVLVLEVKRSAIATAVDGTLNPWQKGHIAFSSFAVALYIPTMIFGARAILKPTLVRKRKVHVYMGRIAFFCRTVGFLLMFSLFEHVKK